MSSIYNNGKTWVYQFSVKDPDTGYRKRKYQVLGPNIGKDEIPLLKKQLDTKYEKYDLRETISPTLYLSHCKKIYIEQKEKEVDQNRRSVNTLRTDKNSLNLFYEYIHSHYGDMDVKKITQKHINRWREFRYTEKQVTSPTTISVNMRTVRSFFTFLVKTERIESNPFEKVDIPTTRKRKDENITEIFSSLYKFTGKEISKRSRRKTKIRKPRLNNQKEGIEWFYDNDWFIHYLWILLNTGMRSGEVSLLKWKRGKFDEGDDHSRSYSYISSDNTHIVIFFKRRKREISLKKPVRDSLNHIRTTQDNNGTTYVFENPKNGKPHSITSFSKLFKKLVISLKLDDSHTPHSIRHGYGSFLLNNGGNTYQVSRILGHSQREITEMFYTHSIHTDVSDTMDILDKIKK
jgi:integrase